MQTATTLETLKTKSPLQDNVSSLAEQLPPDLTSNNKLY